MTAGISGTRRWRAASPTVSFTVRASCASKGWVQRG